jgi:hydrogenase-4 membrane subunit HyfE
MSEFIVRFLIGGIVVSLFATLDDVLRPKSFAGLFGAAPSIALATIGLTIAKNGPQYAAIEARSMILGAAAFFLYTLCVSWILVRYKPATLTTTATLIPVWLGTSFGLWYWLARSC